jgi:hypothetical protein
VTWNFAISSVFGFPVSGITTPATVIETAVSGPRLWTGGAFGPEGGLGAPVALLAGIAALLWWVRRTEGRVALRPAVARPDLRTEDPNRERPASPGGQSNGDADTAPEEREHGGEAAGSANHDG